MPQESGPAPCRRRHPPGAGRLVAAALALLTTAAPAAARAEQLPLAPGGALALASEGKKSVLSARFWKTKSDTITVSHGESAVVVGKLRSAGGKPIADATLHVEEFLIGAGANAGDRVAVPRVGFARTETDGSFAYRMPAGPSREAILVYRGLGSRATYRVRYLARARPTLHAGPKRVRNKGRPARFWGKLPGPHARGRVVILQAEVTPTHWLTFRAATTDGRGRFRASYLFRRTFVPVVYHFRAVAPRQAGYPWLPGYSRRVSVRVN